MKFTTRQLVTLAIFGALWGVSEISLGSVLHALKIPLTGTFMAAIGLCIALIGRLFVPKQGSTLFIGVIAMFLKLFSIGSILVGPMIGILAEALMAELVLSSFPSPSRFALILGGGLGVLLTFIHPFITNPILFGRGILSVWLDTIDLGVRLFGLPSSAAYVIIAVLAGVHLVIGCTAGGLAWGAGRILQTRMRGTEGFDLSKLEKEVQR
jgi:hypothetical protein